MNVLNSPQSISFVDLHIEDCEAARKNLKALARMSDTNPEHLDSIHRGIIPLYCSFRNLEKKQGMVDSELKERGLEKLKSFLAAFGSEEIDALLQDLLFSQEFVSKKPSVSSLDGSISILDKVKTSVSSLFGLGR